LGLGYFDSKHAAEEIVKAAVRAGKLDARIANPSTVYGPGDAVKGSRKIQVRVAQGRFKVFTEGGVNVVHIDDCLDGCLKIFANGQPGERYILAGENLTVKELFQTIADEAGVSAPFLKLPTFAVHALGKIGDWREAHGHKAMISSDNAWTSTLYHWFSNEKARRELGFQARPAREAIRESVSWMKEQRII
jgi:dihydroflavonol-4-reductase